MLEQHDRSHAVAELIAALPCAVDLPGQWRDNFDKHGLGSVVDTDVRRYSRINCRSHRNLAGLQCQSTLPHLARKQDWQAVYVTNMSREGVGFLHSEALYPCEEMRILILSGQLLRLEIIRCRRLQAGCFEIGAHITGREEWTG